MSELKVKKKKKKEVSDDGLDIDPKEAKALKKAAKKEKKEKKKKKKSEGTRKRRRDDPDSTDADGPTTADASSVGDDTKTSKRGRRAGSGDAPVAAASGASSSGSGATSRKKRKTAESDSDAKATDELKTGDDAMKFDKFRLSESVKTALQANGITALFPIQAQTFNALYDGFDVVARARTGSGKTLAFVLPIVERLAALAKEEPLSAGGFQRAGHPRVIVLAPTRELAKQVALDFERYLKALSLPGVAVVYGGTPYGPQLDALRRGAVVVVGTPGRVSDHLEKGSLVLDRVMFAVLDEADEMLNMGFADATEQILGTIGVGPQQPKQPSVAERTHQTVLFSATLPDWVKGLQRKLMRGDKHVRSFDLATEQAMPTKVRHFALRCPRSVREQTLPDVIKVHGAAGRTLVFTNTKAECNALALSSSLATSGCQVLHGDISQEQREVALAGFRDGQFSVLVATDVAARGLDVPQLDLIVMCQPPDSAETYVHRAGRTGRAGRPGTVITFATRHDEARLTRLERSIGLQIKQIGTPQPADLYAAGAIQVRDKLDKLDDSLPEHFAPAARELIAELGAEQALSAVLAIASGYTEPVRSRSLLASVEGYTTLMIRSLRPGNDIRSPVFVVNMLRELMPGHAQVRDVRLCADGALADVPEKTVKALVGADVRRGDYAIELCTELPPDVKENFVRGTSSGRGRGGGGSYGGGSRGGYRGRGGGYGSPSFGGRGGSRGGGFRGRGRGNFSRFR